MTRKFFAKVLTIGGAVTRKYFYMVEVSGNVKRIVRYPRRPSGDCWLDAGYVCAVYAR